MPTPKTTFDEKCGDLAESFLEEESGLNTARHVSELASEIQATIENYIERKRQDYEPPDPPGFEGGFAENH
jgi:hypothetical protein